MIINCTSEYRLSNLVAIEAARLNSTQRANHDAMMHQSYSVCV